jgi:hypothetical protein
VGLERGANRGGAVLLENARREAVQDARFADLRVPDEDDLHADGFSEAPIALLMGFCVAVVRKKKLIAEK